MCICEGIEMLHPFISKPSLWSEKKENVHSLKFLLVLRRFKLNEKVFLVKKLVLLIIPLMS